MIYTYNINNNFKGGNKIMNEYLEKAKDWTGCDNAEIICSSEDGTWNLIVCTDTDRKGNCPCWLLRVWKNTLGTDLSLSVDYENTVRVEDANIHIVSVGKAIAKWISR